MTNKHKLYDVIIWSENDGVEFVLDKYITILDSTKDLKQQLSVDKYLKYYNIDNIEIKEVKLPNYDILITAKEISENNESC